MKPFDTYEKQVLAKCYQFLAENSDTINPPSSDRHNAQPGAPVRGQGVPVAAREGAQDSAVQQGPRRPHQGRLRIHHLEGHTTAGQSGVQLQF